MELAGISNNRDRCGREHPGLISDRHLQATPGRCLQPDSTPPGNISHPGPWTGRSVSASPAPKDSRLALTVILASALEHVRLVRQLWHPERPQGSCSRPTLVARRPGDLFGFGGQDLGQLGSGFGSANPTLHGPRRSHQLHRCQPARGRSHSQRIG